MDKKQDPQQGNTATREAWLSMDSGEPISEKMMEEIDEHEESDVNPASEDDSLPKQHGVSGDSP